MAFSSMLRTAAFRASPSLNLITKQVLRSSSLCAKSSTERPQTALLPAPALATRSAGSSSILAKYLSTTQKLSSSDSHNHVTVWKLERILSAALLPLIPAALISPSPMLDTLVAVTIVMHTHWGLEALVVDYVRPILFGEIGPKIGMGLLYIFSAITLAGCLNLIYNDVGLANAFLAIWKL